MSRPSILYVIPPVGGTPAPFALPRLARHGDVHALAFAATPPAPDAALQDSCASVAYRDLDEPMPEAIVSVARQVGADAVLTLSETGIVAVAQACEVLGLRGPGPRVLASRDKVLMRRRWAAAGLPIPAFAPVRSAADLRSAAGHLRRPFLLKPAWLAGSLGQVMVEPGADLGAAWQQAAEAIERAERAGVRDFLPAGRGAQCIAEELIEATTESWYEAPVYGDYVSVEGLVVGGVYRPICITGRLPTLPPFIEVGFQSPSVLPEALQRRIAGLAGAAVDALGLLDCATHTEIKLQREQGMCLVENAARLGGAMIARLVQEAFGVDLIDLLIGVLLGEPEDRLPERMLTAGSSGVFVSSLMMVAADSAGRPWREAEAVPYRPDAVDWAALVSPGTTVEVVPGPRRLGSPMPSYSPTGGTLNHAGMLVLSAPDAAVLTGDCYRILDGLEVAMTHAPQRTAGTPVAVG